MAERSNDPTSDEFWNEVTAWNIAPLKYGTPRGFEININRQELGFFDTAMLCDPDLTPIEIRLLIDICSFYPTEFYDVHPSEGIHGRVSKGIEDPVLVRDTLLSLRDRGYITLSSEA